MVIPTTPTNPTAPTQSLKTTEIPEWVKNNALWWADGLITDEGFSTGIEYMIKEGIISIPQIQTENNVGTTSGKIPDWVKNNARRWSDGLITDEGFSTGLEYMIKEGILTI